MKKLSDADKETVIEEVKRLLSGREEVIFGLLYGSLLDPLVPERYGDIDVAVYVKSEAIETAEFVLESRIEAEACNSLRTIGLDFPPLELRIINNAPYPFLIGLFKGKYVVLKENEEVMTDFIEEISGRALENAHLRSESLREVAEG